MIAGVPGARQSIVTVKGLDQGETTDIWLAHLACAVTLYIPEMDQLFEALVCPTASHPEFVPSPQSKRYCTESPELEDEPPVE